jgi:hypothetical protein
MVRRKSSNTARVDNLLNQAVLGNKGCSCSMPLRILPSLPRRPIQNGDDRRIVFSSALLSPTDSETRHTCIQRLKWILSLERLQRQTLVQELLHPRVLKRQLQQLRLYKALLP